MAEKLTPEYLDFIYRNTGGKMGKPMQSAPQQPVAPPAEQPQRRKYELPENRLSKFLVALGGGDPANIDQMALAAEQHRSLYDPESERSRIARDIAMKVGAPATPDLAAGDIESYLPSYERLLALRAKGSGGPKVPKLTQDERNVAGFAQRIRNAADILKTIKPETAAPSFIESRLGIEAPEYFKSSERQKADQATRDFVNAQLRRESGAAISPSEFENARMQYFPQPGDSPQVIQQKEIARENAFRNMKFSAGPAYEALQQEYSTQGPPAENRSTGAGDVTKEVWQTPDGQIRMKSPSDPDYEEFVASAKKRNAKRVK